MKRFSTREGTATRHVVVWAAFVGTLVEMLLIAPPAQAQLHWDASAQVGAMKRVLGNRPTGGSDTLWGPAAELTAHIALLPLVRVGAYFGHDISPFDGDASARDITWGGLRAKIMSPWPRGDGRVWLFFGFGYAGVYQRSTSKSESFPGPAATGPMAVVTTTQTVHGAGGGFFEVPFGIGASYMLRKPWQLCFEIGGRAGFDHTGSVYGAGPGRTGGGGAPGNVPPAGTDGFAIGITVGVLLDQ
jgi:hypothetical protein